ncbi:hypothetical protein [Ornithobacterium rhinotracheale]|uniref:hypothetical protein n=1 Tax=Ornithobacterium rhinotracheale TaxID=28251 RepID=UPI001FF58A7D|nr:hypothetical protein [Ornithobacterium rhinotracheale]MCK0201180.1 hypothetical protein [Ornithobacterium rhinotracheale]MCK0204450.1 hypothetical protein [Ornithobacterium rhinotracheale]
MKKLVLTLAFIATGLSATNVYAADNGGVRDSKEVVASTGKDGYINIKVEKPTLVKIYAEDGMFVKKMIVRPGLNEVQIDDMKEGKYFVHLNNYSFILLRK